MLKHNSLNKYFEEFSRNMQFIIAAKYFFAIDTIDAKINHVYIILIINYYHEYREDF